MYWLVMIFTFLLLFDQIRISLLTQSVFMPGAGLDAIGIAIAILGLIIAVWARVMLSNNWSGAVVLKENHTLITTGPYRYVRHPIYTGLLVMMLGTVFISGRVDAVCAILIFFAAHIRKMRQEEVLMQNNFPGYADYKKHTKALFPLIF